MSQPLPSEDRSRTVLEFVHGLLLAAASVRELDELLAGLARAFGADGAGVAVVPADGAPEVRGHARCAGPATGRPWEDEPGLPARVTAAPAPVTVRRAAGGGWLVAGLAPGNGVRLLLWLEDAGRCFWSPAETAALALAGHAFAAARDAGGAPLWALDVEHAGRRQRHEQTVAIVQRLAHDFANLLMSIHGFAELAAAQLAQESPARGHLAEVLRTAEQAGRALERLRLLSRRGPTPPRATSPSAAITEQAGRLRQSCGPSVHLRVQTTAELPPVRIDGELLGEVLRAVLDNARESLGGAGSITVVARAVDLTSADCLGLFGNPEPGPSVEVTVSDSGCGLRPEVRRRLLVEPFFSDKPRHRGLGLAVVQGILHAHRGGFRLDPGPEHGTVVRLYLPTAGACSPGNPTPPRNPARDDERPPRTKLRSNLW